MPAPSQFALRDFETQFDEFMASILAVFATAPYSLQLADINTRVDLVVPRLEYEFGVNEPVGPGGSNLVRPTTGAQIAYSGTFTFRHVYDHTKTTPAQLATFRGALRTLLSPETKAATAGNLPYLDIAALTEVSSARGRFKEAETDKLLTEWLSTWAVSWVIRESAWPA